MNVKKVRVILSTEAEEVYKNLNKEASTSKTERMIQQEDRVNQNQSSLW